MPDNQTNIKALEEGRAQYAYSCVQDALKKFPRLESSKDASKNAKSYKAYSKKLPMMIKTNGLGASLAFVLSRSKSDLNNPWGLLYHHINLWLRTDHKKFLLGENPKPDIADAVINLESHQYRAVSIEVLAFLTWLRRFSEGLIEGEADEN